MGRPPALTKIGARSVHTVRTRGGNTKYRALRLDVGNFAWGSENCTRKARILSVAYNASNNEYVRTNTLVKGSIVQVDAAPFVKYYEQHYGVSLSKKKKKEEGATEEQKKQSKHVLAKLKHRKEGHQLDANIDEQFKAGRLYAFVSSRPGQTGRADGYILESKELEFYLKKMQKKKEAKGKAQ
eukprot:TRINITY_DN34492_c0_g1_i1.p1 TRINITY_DN34492_c0_g1~~TRINITY_DN34492_c0_g1_i1.p1  ORF type:complete len:183 (-),score=72.47 TRINITY_DN34492_c0_g1_i1:24-572(-)